MSVSRFSCRNTGDEEEPENPGGMTPENDRPTTDGKEKCSELDIGEYGLMRMALAGGYMGMTM